MRVRRKFEQLARVVVFEVAAPLAQALSRDFQVVLELRRLGIELV